MYLFFLKSGGGVRKKSKTLCVCLSKSNSTKPASSVLPWGGCSGALLEPLAVSWQHQLSISSGQRESEVFLQYILYIYSIPGTLHSGDNSEHIDKTVCPYIL